MLFSSTLSFIIFFIIECIFYIQFYYSRKYEEKKMIMTYFDFQKEEEKNMKHKIEIKDSGGKGPQSGRLEANYFVERFQKNGIKYDIPVDDHMM